MYTMDFGTTLINRWHRYFPGADLPIAWFYADQVPQEEPADADGMRRTDRCLICNVARVREGTPYVYDAHTPGCPGGKRYTGFAQALRPNFEYFLSCGIPGKMEGERYKQSPELVEAYLAQHPSFEAPGRYLVFKRWDTLGPDEAPQAAIIFATPDMLAGLFTLANYDLADPDGVLAPFGSGCASIVTYPLEQATTATPRCVLGMFDVSARPCVPATTLTFAAPIARFVTMVSHMDESFLTTAAWHAVRDRFQAARG